MAADDSLRPTLTEKAVEQALEVMRTGQALPNDHPLRFFLTVLVRLQSPEMLTGDAAVQVAVFSYLTQTIVRQRQDLRRICGLTGDGRDLEEDFQQSNTELEVWSILYYRYVRIEYSLTMQLIAYHTRQDERTLRRRHSVGMTRLTHALIDSEQEARRVHARQRLKLALPTVYPPSLVGAEALLATAQHIVAEVEPPSHLILHGPAGIGKTSLALAVAHGLVEQEAIEDIVWINLRGFSIDNLEGLIQKFVSSLGLPSTEADSSVQTLRAYCFSHSVLFVLDAAEQLFEKVWLIEALLNLLDVAHIIITSRVAAPSSLWLHSISVPELSRDAAYKFLEGLDMSQQEHILRSFDAIWSTVGGNPLALKLVAGSTHYLPLSGVLQSTNHLLQQIWDELQLNEQQALLLTLLFERNAVPYEAFQYLLSEEPVDQIIETLISKSLLMLQYKGSYLYTVTTLMMSFLLDKVRRGKDDPAYLFLVQILPQQVAFLLKSPLSSSALIVLELARMLEVDVETRCRYAFDLAPQITEDGLWHTWFNTILSLYDICRNPVYKLRLAYLIGETLRWHGEFDQAKVYLHEAVTSIAHRASALVELSVIARYQGYWEEALYLAQDAMDRYKQDGQVAGIDRCIHEISQIVLESGDAISALTWLSRLQEWTYRSWGIASQSYLILKEYEEALIAAEKALALLPMGHPNRGRALATIGQIYHEMGQSDRAVEHLLVAADLLDQAKDVLGHARTSNNLAIAYFNQLSAHRQIPLDKIYQLLTRAYEVQSYIHDEIGLAVTRQNLSWLEKVKKSDASG